MSGRLRRLAVLAAVPTAVDVVGFLLLRQVAGWILVLADLTAIALASVLSYVLHRTVTFRSDPFVRWVRMPVAFVAVATLAAVVDVLVLRGIYAAHELTATWPLLTAKIAAVGVAAVVRLALYRAILLVAVRGSIHERTGRPAPVAPLRATVVVPALDEATRIGGTVAAVRAALADLADTGGLEIVVVDDGSTDGTADAALAAGADQVVVLPENFGKGAAVRAGVAAARGRTIAFTDADLSYSPDQLLGVISRVEEGWDVAVGSRRHPETTTVQGAGAVRDLGSRVINLVTMAVLLSHPHDTQCGLKAFRADVAGALFAVARVDGFAFDIELLHLVERHELSLVEVPVRLTSSGRSTVSVARDGLRLLRDVWRIRHWSATGCYEVADGVWSPSMAVGGASTPH